MLLRPADIATRRFPRRVFGVDPKAAYRFLGEIAAGLHRMNEEMTRVMAERDEAMAARNAADAHGEAVAKQIAELEERVRTHRAQEALIARTLVLAQRAQQDIVARAQAEAGQTVAAARGEAGEIIRSSRRSAARMLRDAKRTARQAVQSAHRAAEAQLSLARTESKRLVEETHAVTARIQSVTRRQLDMLTAKIEFILAERDAAAQRRPGPDPLADSGSDLDAIKTLLAELRAVTRAHSGEPDRR